uniref:Vacuolar protein sorting-associated protein 18 homolog n=1 Tax=Caenorhabditis tropicalis TaxID=1561998 RepID=A0A1I7V0X9_9PELO
MCRACRYSKCLEAGMNPMGVQQKPEASLMLAKMNDAYRNLLATRITVLRGRSLFPRAIDYREAIEQGIKDVPLVANWVSQCFGKDFRELKEKNVLFENFYTRFCQLEITFTSHLKKTPDLIQLPSGDYIDMENLDRFYKDEQQMGKEEIERLFKPFYTMQKRSLILPMISLNLDHFEFLALCTLILWDTSLEGLSKETVLLSAKVKDQVMKELAAHLKNSIKMAAIVNLLPAVERFQNGEMLAAINEKTLVHWREGERPQELSLPLQSPDTVAYIHLSPTGFHAIVSTKLGQNFYIHVKSNTVHHLKKLKCLVTAVGWNPDYSKETEVTGPILMGSVKGSVIEMNVGSSGMMTCLKELIGQVALVSEQRAAGGTVAATAAITDIQLFQLTDDDATSPKPKKWLTIIAQMARLIVLSTELDPPAPPVKIGGFTSSASLQAGLMNLNLAEAPPTTTFHTLFQSPLSHTITASKFSEKFKNGYLTMHPMIDPKRYAWISPDGISIGRVNVYAERIQDVLEEEFNIEHRLIEGRLEPPTGIALTDYHILLAYSTRLLALSLLPPHNVALEDAWNQELGPSIGFQTDTTTEFYWLYTSTVAMKYGTNDEARYIWKTYLDRGDYVKALQIARMRKEIEPDALEMVLRRQADFYIQEKNYTAAAEILAQSSEPFESVVLKFLTNSSERKMGLKTLLDKKLERLTRHEDKMRRDALVMWLLNVQLEELAEMRRMKAHSQDPGYGEKLKDTTDHVQRYFMRKNVIESIQTNREAVYRMCVAHADFEMQLFFAHAVKDLRTEIEILMLREQYIEVLELLRSQRISELTYEMLPLLIEHIPKQIIVFLIQTPEISPHKLTPCISLCVKNLEMAIPAIKYLETVFKFQNPNADSKTLHNIYLHLLAKFRKERVLPYLESHGTIRSEIPYDLDFAMRTMEQFNLEEPIVFLYTVAGMYGDAVEKALGFSVDLAKRCALQIEDTEPWLLEQEDYCRQKLDEKGKKAIWLKIGQYYVARGETEQCIQLIQESDHLISIQDLLPIIPKFTKIGTLKPVIVDFLMRNKERLEKLERNMKEATDIASEIRDKQERLKNRTTVVKPSDICAHCTRPISGRPFNVHSCRHFFHRECLESAMIPFLTPEDVSRMRGLIGEEERCLGQMKAEQLAGNQKGGREKQEKYLRIATAISAILGSECPLCGDIAISLIDKPFMSDEEFAVDLNSWIL